MKKILLLASITALGATSAFALNASDNASNYGGSWNDGNTGGSGFGAWDLTDNNNNGTDVFSGYLIQDSTSGAGNLNVSGVSFGIYANPATAFATAKRSFNSALVLNDQFSFNFGVQNDNGNKGFTIRNDSDQEVFGFNIGNGANVNTAFTDNSSSTVYDFGGGDAVLQAVITVIDDSVGSSQLSYSISRVSSSGTQGVLYSGTVIGITGAIDNFTFYNSGTENGAAANNLYFNSLDVTSVPEPGTYALLAGLLALTWVATRRR